MPDITMYPDDVDPKQELERLRFEVAACAATLVKWALAAGGHSPSAIVAGQLRELAGPDAVAAVAAAIERQDSTS